LPVTPEREAWETEGKIGILDRCTEGCTTLVDDEDTEGCVIVAIGDGDNVNND